MLKSSGDIEGAIAHLRAAYALIAATLISYSVQTFLRLPLYLQIAGRGDEAWQEFNNLLARGFPNQLQNKGTIPMDRCIIYDKMRLFMQREGRNKEAVMFGVFSYLCMLQGLFFQKRESELEGNMNRQLIQAIVDGLLKKAKKVGASESIVSLIEDEIRNLPDIDFDKIGKRVSESM